MGILLWIVFGLIAGFLAKWIMPGKAPGGLIMTCLLGIGGALVGGFIGSYVLGVDVTGFNLSSMAIAVGGALLLLVIYGFLQKR